MNIDCPHCRRSIPEDMIHTFDMSGCPLKVQCQQQDAAGLIAAAWPAPEDDEDEGGDEQREPQPVLSGGA